MTILVSFLYDIGQCPIPNIYATSYAFAIIALLPGNLTYFLGADQVLNQKQIVAFAATINLLTIEYYMSEVKGLIGRS